jgi:SAM-dependent methyltransferase
MRAGQVSRCATLTDMTSERHLRTTFDKSAAIYQSARPDYPVELINDLITDSHLTPQSAILEIGPGSGKATVPLAERGFMITAIELGPDLADRARANLAGFPDVTVVNSSFEDWQPTGGQLYELIYAATSWHWLDDSKWERAAALLRPGGRLATFGATHAFPPDFDPFFTEIQATYDEIEQSVHDWPPAPPDQLGDPTPEYERSGHFLVESVRRYVWALQYDADSYIELLRTFSGHIAMASADRERLFRRIRELLSERSDGLLTRHWISTLVIAGKR